MRTHSNPSTRQGNSRVKTTKRTTRAVVALLTLAACSISAGTSQAALIAADSFKNDPLNPTNPNLANGEYVTTSGVNQLRRSTANGAGQNPTVAGFTGAWSGNVTSGTLAVAQWTSESAGIVMPETADYHLGGRARYGGASTTATLQRRVQRALSSYTPSNTYYMSITSQVLLSDSATSVTGFVGGGFTSSSSGSGDTHFDNSGTAMRGLLIGAARDSVGGHTDYVIRHVGSSGLMQQNLLENNILQTDGIQTVIARLTIVRVDINDDPTNPAGNSKLTIWHQPTLSSLGSEAAATAAQAPIELRTFGFTTTSDLTQLTLLGFNWNKAASFDEPRLATTWSSVIPIPEPMVAGLLIGAAFTLLRRQ